MTGIYPGVLLLGAVSVVSCVIFLRLLRKNSDRLRSIYRLTRGHLIAALALALLSPLGAIYALPISGLYLATDPDFSKTAIGLWTLFLCVFWYIPASLAVSGTSNKLFRILTLLAFWSGYVAIVVLVQLMTGSEGYFLPGILR